MKIYEETKRGSDREENLYKSKKKTIIKFLRYFKNMSLNIPNVDILDRIRFKNTLPNGIEMKYIDDALYICKVDDLGNVISGAEVVLDVLPNLVPQSAAESENPAPSYTFEGASAVHQPDPMHEHNLWVYTNTAGGPDLNAAGFVQNDYVSVSVTYSGSTVLVYGSIEYIVSGDNPEMFINLVEGYWQYVENLGSGLNTAVAVVQKIQQSEIPIP